MVNTALSHSFLDLWLPSNSKLPYFFFAGTGGENSWTFPLCLHKVNSFLFLFLQYSIVYPPHSRAHITIYMVALALELCSN